MQRQPATPARLAAIAPAAQRDIVRAVAAARPIDDLLGWLIAEYPDANREWVFAALKAIYEGGFEIASASQQMKSYRIGREELKAFPQRVA
ncbi:MAG: hypothetical protein GY937_15130 [bacterium]|nr:hypothetical protein [bacterium]